VGAEQCRCLLMILRQRHIQCCAPLLRQVLGLPGLSLSCVTSSVSDDLLQLVLHLLNKQLLRLSSAATC
jgi:hypothetical protein